MGLLLRHFIAAAWLTLAVASEPLAEPLFVFGLSGGTQTIFQTDTAAPGTITAAVPITGLAPGEMLNAIDFRPSNDLLYGATNQGGIYTLNTTTGAATLAANASMALGNIGAADFNPVTSTLRALTNTGQNVEINVTSGAVLVDTPVAFASSDPNAGRFPLIGGIAFTNSFLGATSTQLFGAGSPLGFTPILVGIPDPAAGTLFTIGGLASPAPLDLDISGLTGLAYEIGGANQLFQIDLATGANTLLGLIAGGPPSTTGFQVLDIATPLGPGVPTGVPEPSTTILLVLGCSILLATRGLLTSTPCYRNGSTHDCPL